MEYLNHTHDINAKSWVTSANAAESHFPVQNLPFAIFRRKASGERWRGGVAIGDQILDIANAYHRNLFAGAARDAASAASQEAFNDLFALGPSAWQALRHALFALMRQGGPSDTQMSTLRECLVEQADAEYNLPARIGDYTDYFTSLDHAVNCGRLFDPANELPPSFRWIPMAYHGRVSTIGVAGQTFRRPTGQFLPTGSREPIYQPTLKLDYECELGMFIGPGNQAGERISIDDAENQIFGVCMLNDWSARDIQAWEMNPLGPFHAKNFATTISPWIVTMEALAPYRKPAVRADSEPQPLSYLDSAENRSSGAFDIRLEVFIETETMRANGRKPPLVSATSFEHQYWTLAQMVTHHAAGGCALRPGDLLGTGTISGPTRFEAGALIELGLAGREPVQLGDGEERGFLADGDAVVFEGHCERDGFVRIGFGKNYGRVLPAVAPSIDTAAASRGETSEHLAV